MVVENKFAFGQKMSELYLTNPFGYAKLYMY